MYEKEVSESLNSLNNYHFAFRLFVRILFLLYELYNLIRNLVSIVYNIPNWLFLSKTLLWLWHCWRDFLRHWKGPNKKLLNSRKYSNKIRFAYMENNVTSVKYRESINNIMQRNIHLHHSDTAWQITGHAHSFCKLKVRETKDFFSVSWTQPIWVWIFLFCPGSETLCFEN